MRTSSTTPLVAAFVVVGAGLTALVGPAGLLGGLVLLALATLIWGPGRANHPAGASWRMLLLAGAALLVGVVAVTSATGELPAGGWYIAMGTLLTSFALLGSGLVIGIACRFRTGPM